MLAEILSPTNEACTLANAIELAERTSTNFNPLAKGSAIKLATWRELNLLLTNPGTVVLFFTQK